MTAPTSPFDPDLLLGIVGRVTPAEVVCTLPGAAEENTRYHFDTHVTGGTVGDYVFVEAREAALFGRLVEVGIPAAERWLLDRPDHDQKRLNPRGVIRLLASLELETGKVRTGVDSLPRLGARVFLARGRLVQWMADNPTSGSNAVRLELGNLEGAGDLSIAPESLFGRHLGILGATGGGKSWSIARLIESALSFKAKIILVDATGEFRTLDKVATHVFVGKGVEQPEATEVAVPYDELLESDITRLLQPAGRVQAPKLRDAMKSLKLAKLEPQLAIDGFIVKENQERGPFDAAYQEHAGKVEDSSADFDIAKLARQIREECVYPTSNRNSTRFGSQSGEFAYCVSLVSRIEDALSSEALSPILRPQKRPSVFRAIENFMTSEEKVLRISLAALPFTHNVREIVVDVVGRYLLRRARHGEFRDHPTLVVLDEAHQFLESSISEEAALPLDAFGQIAKEGRKYSLSVCLASQRPRDIPDDVLSQLGTLLVHRLAHDRDRIAVERACSDLDRSVASFLPALQAGEAILVGVSLPLSVILRVSPPASEPASYGPDFQRHWRSSW